METKTFYSKDIEKIKMSIEKMTNQHQLQFLQFFVDHEVTINENKSGIRINLGYLYKTHRDIFEKMLVLLETLEKEENNFNMMENEKAILVQSLKTE